MVQAGRLHACKLRRLKCALSRRRRLRSLGPTSPAPARCRPSSSKACRRPEEACHAEQSIFNCHIHCCWSSAERIWRMANKSSVDANYRFIAASQEVNARINQRQQALALYVTLAVSLLAALVALKPSEGKSPVPAEWLLLGFPSGLWEPTRRAGSMTTRRLFWLPVAIPLVWVPFSKSIHSVSRRSQSPFGCPLQSQRALCWRCFSAPAGVLPQVKRRANMSFPRTPSAAAEARR